MSKNVRFRTDSKSKNYGQYRLWALIALVLVFAVIVSSYLILKNNDFDFRAALGGDPEATAQEDEVNTLSAEKSDRYFLFWCNDSVSGDLQFFWITKISQPKGKYTILSPSLDENMDYKGTYMTFGKIFSLYGDEGLCEAAEKYCNIKIDHRIGSDTEQFKQTVNYFGSVTVDLSESIEYRGRFNLILMKGSNTLKGDTLYKYLVYTNFIEGNSQKIRCSVLEQILINVINPENAVSLDKIYSRLANTIKTDVTIVGFSAMKGYLTQVFNTGVNETVFAEKPSQL